MLCDVCLSIASVLSLKSGDKRYKTGDTPSSDAAITGGFCVLSKDMDEKCCLFFKVVKHVDFTCESTVTSGSSHIFSFSPALVAKTGISGLG
jgi:hypothetical protein